MGDLGKTISKGIRSVTGKPDPEAQEDAADASANATNILSAISQNYYKKTAGLRGSVIDRLTKFMKGDFDPTDSALYAPIKTATENQYQKGMDELLSTVPRGGGLYAGIGDLIGKKADTTSDLIAQLVQDEYNKAYAMGTGSQEVAASGLSGAGTGANGLVSALASQQNAGVNQTKNLADILSKIMRNI